MADRVLLASGRSADVFAIDDGRVLRRYRDGGDATAEASIMAYAAAAGFPVPQVYEVDGADLVMERLDGPTMLAALIAGDIGDRTGAELLADLHDRLHALPAPHSPCPGIGVLHLDLHPDNVILSPRGPVVIDWRNATQGPPDLDLAMSAVILAQVAVDRTHDMAEAAGGFLTAFLRCAGGDPGRLLDDALAMRRRDPALATREIDLLNPAATLIRDRL